MVSEGQTGTTDSSYTSSQYSDITGVLNGEEKNYNTDFFLIFKLKKLFWAVFMTWFLNLNGKGTRYLPIFKTGEKKVIWQCGVQYDILCLLFEHESSIWQIS